MFRKRDKRKSCRVHDRQIDRNVCRMDLKKRGVSRPNKKVGKLWIQYQEG